MMVIIMTKQACGGGMKRPARVQREKCSATHAPVGLNGMYCLHSLLVRDAHVALGLVVGVSNVDKLDQVAPVVLAVEDLRYGGGVGREGVVRGKFEVADPLTRALLPL